MDNIPTPPRSCASAPRVGLFLKLMAAFAVVVLTVGVLVTWLAGRATRQEFHLYTTEAGQFRAERLVPFLASYYQTNGGWEDVEIALSLPQMDGMDGMKGPPPFARDTGGRRSNIDMWRVIGAQVLVADATGRVVADSAGELIGLQLDADSLTAGAPIWSGEQQVGTALVTFGELSAAENDRFLQQVNQATLLAALVAGLVALLLGGLITWGITRPVRALTQAARAIAAGDLARRVEAPAGDEVGDLAAAFNQMAAELERAETLRKQMTADIAHELRTPLSVIQGNVEALQDGVFPLTIDSLAPIQAKTELMARLVEDLRRLALAEAGQLPLDRQPTDLAALAERTAAGFQAPAEAKSISLQVKKDDGAPLADADPQRIEQVLVNLLSNALRHTPEGGAITINISAVSPQKVNVRVSDTGPGIPAEALPKVFDRFYRVDQGRARGRDGDGSGLGLAVARSIVEAHRGTIGVESAPGQGASFWFTLPALS